MSTELIVPLDGSPLADLAISHAAEIARRIDGSLHLVRVHTPLSMAAVASDAMVSIPDPVLDARIRHDASVARLAGTRSRRMEPRSGDVRVAGGIARGGDRAGVRRATRQAHRVHDARCGKRNDTVARQHGRWHRAARVVSGAGDVASGCRTRRARPLAPRAARSAPKPPARSSRTPLGSRPRSPPRSTTCASCRRRIIPRSPSSTTSQRQSPMSSRSRRTAAGSCACFSAESQMKSCAPPNVRRSCSGRRDFRGPSASKTTPQLGQPRADRPSPREIVRRERETRNAPDAGRAFDPDPPAVTSTMPRAIASPSRRPNGSCVSTARSDRKRTEDLPVRMPIPVSCTLNHE